jgi:hypothetical protein
MTPYPWRELAEYVEATAGYNSAEGCQGYRRALEAYLAAVDAWRANGGDKPEPPATPAPERTCEEILEGMFRFIKDHRHKCGFEPWAGYYGQALAAHRAEVAALKAQVERLTKERDSLRSNLRTVVDALGREP